MLHQAKQNVICKHSGLKIDQVGCNPGGSRVMKAWARTVTAGKEKQDWKSPGKDWVFIAFGK